MRTAREAGFQKSIPPPCIVPLRGGSPVVGVQAVMMVDDPAHEVYLDEKVTPNLSASRSDRMDKTALLSTHARQLDPRALALIHDQYYPQVYRYVHYRLDDEQTCEDITSEVFLRLLTALHKKNGPDKNLRAWLFGTAAHLVNDHLRAKYRRPMTGLEDGDGSLVSHHSPEEDAERAWQWGEVRAAFLNLTFEQQHVLALRFSEDHSVEETAHIMGKTAGAVKTLQFRALSALRRLLEEKPKP